ncbi:Diphthamide synthase [Candidatus Anstonella stagnisolia]|nr:Diphthamide synthase [Candidatus Anstonella stagnisolia]
MKVAVLFSGGKDSTLAAFCCLYSGWDVVLVSMHSGEGSMMFHHPNVEYCKMLAKAMNLPHIEVKTSNDDELADLKSALSKLNVDAVATGAIESEYQKQRIDRICEELGVRSFSPIWRKNKELMLQELQGYFEIYVVALAADGLDESMLGRKFDASFSAEMKRKSPSASPVFEGGEGETFVANAPFFGKRVEVGAWEKEWKGTSGAAHIKSAKLI